MSNQRSTVTIKDVARVAGVSHATVSRVINDTGYIKESTRRAVHDAINRLGYVPNLSARSLVGASTKLIGLLLSDFNDPFTGTLANYVDAELNKAGYDIAVFPHHGSPRREKALLQRATGGLLEGLIIMVMGMPETYVDFLSSRGIPFVLLGSELAHRDQPMISQTNWQGAYDATDHLLKLGHKRIAYLRGAEGRVSSLDREDGYKSALLDYDIQPAPTFIESGGYSHKEGREATLRLLDLEEPPTAIFAGNDYSALGAISAADERRIRVPDDISIVGFDNIAAAETATPPLTTIDVPLDKMAREAVRMLLERLEDVNSRVRKVTVSTKLIIRDSTAKLDLATG